jgi:hypothetical protein
MAAVSIVSVNATPSASGTLKTGQFVTFTLTLSQNVAVEGLPTLILNDGGVAVYSPLLSNLPNVMVFTYIVAPGQATSNLSILGLTTNGGSISGIGALLFEPQKNFNVAGRYPSSMATGDFDGDGKLDLVTANTPSGVVSVQLNSSSGAILGALGFGGIDFSKARKFVSGPEPNPGAGPLGDPQHVAVGDVDGDRRLDIIVRDSLGAVNWLRGTGNGSFEAAKLLVQGQGRGGGALATGSLNGDDKLDYVIESGPRHVSVVLSDEGGGLKAPVTYEVSSTPWAIVVQDVNRDGKSDLLVASDVNNTVSVLLNDGSGAFGAGTTLTVGAQPQAMVAADLNGDGKVDLAVASLIDNTVSVFLGKGNGEFGPEETFGTMDGPLSIAAGDIDGDGKTDLVVGSNGWVSILQGDGEGGFATPHRISTGAFAVAVNVADYNNDGLLDVAIDDQRNDRTTILQNDSIVPAELYVSSLYLHPTIITGIAVDAAPPTILSRSTDPDTGSFGAGTTIGITFTFSKKVLVSGVPVLMLSDGAIASYVTGSGTENISFATTIVAGQNAEDLTVTDILLPAGATIADVAGNNADLGRALATFSGLDVDTLSPNVAAGVAGPATGQYGAGQIVTLTLTSSEALTVTGIPTLTLNDGGTATYVSGSGTGVLTFRYVVGAGEKTDNLAVTGVTLPGGATIRDAAGNTANLASAPAIFPGLVIDATAPAVLSVAASPGTGNLEVGQTVTFTLTFSGAVNVTGAVALALNDGGTARYVGGSGTTHLTFSSTIEAGQNAAALGITGVTLPAGASITAVAGGAAAYLVPAVKTFPAITVDSTAPRVRAVHASPSDTVVGVGATITLSVEMSKLVSVTGGVPTLKLNDGGTATYVSGSGTNTLVFRTTVLPGQVTDDLAVTAVRLNGAVVADSMGRAAKLAGAVTNPDGILAVAGGGVTIKAIVATPSDTGTLGVGDSVTFTATLQRAVTVTGAPVLTLNDGGTALYDAAASTSTRLVFHTTIAAGQNAANLTVTGMVLGRAKIDVPDSPLTFAPPSGLPDVYAKTTIADVNGDGQPDLLFPDLNDRAGILLGDGRGGFFSPTYVSAPMPLEIAFVDMNHDNAPDLVMPFRSTNGAGGGVSVALGDGAGNFGNPTVYNLGTYYDPVTEEFRAQNPRSIAIGDMNGDGTPDLVAGDNFIGPIFVMLGDGAGGLGAPINAGQLPTRSAQNFIALNDVDGDGKLDVVSADLFGNVFFMLGDGSGGLGSPVSLITPAFTAGAFGLAMADLNGDGNSDLAVNFLDPATTAVWLADGHGGFGTPTLYDNNDIANRTAQAGAVALADLSGDGKPDLVTYSDALGTVDVRLGDGPGGFGGSIHLNVGNAFTAFAAYLTVGDLNNDGRADLVATRNLVASTNNGTKVLMNTTIAPNVFDPAGVATARGVATGIAVDTAGPTIVGVAANPVRGSYDVGQTIFFTVTGNENLVVSGTPVLTLNDGGTANYVLGSGTKTLLFASTIAAGQNAATLAVTGATLPLGASIRDAVGNDANLAGAAASFSGLSVVTTAPAVRSVTTDPTDATLGAGAIVTLRVTMNKPVFVSSGVPTLTLNDGGIARYVSGSGTDTLLFSHAIAPGNASPDLAVTAVSLNGALVADGRGAVADLTGAAVNPAGTLAVSVRPVTVTGITATPSASVPLGLGQTVTFTVAVSDPVTVTGTPRLTLNDSGTARYDAAASTSTSLVFRTTIVAGQNTSNLAVTGLTLNGATIAAPGGFAFATPVAYAAGVYVTGVPPDGYQPFLRPVGDLNGDGRTDLAFTNADGTVSLLFGRGAGTFAPAVGVATTGVGPEGVAAADVNGDGRPDLIVADGLTVDGSTGTVSILLGTGAGSFAAPTAIPVNGGSQTRSVTVADVNGDGRPDLVVNVGVSVAVLVGNGAGGFAAAGTYGQGGNLQDVIVADMNGDLRPDLIVADAGTYSEDHPSGTKGGVSVLLGDGSGGFGAPVRHAADMFPSAVAAADVNADGVQDLIVASIFRGTVSVLRGNGFGGFLPAVDYAVGFPKDIAVADLNGDGVTDIALSDTGHLDVLLGNGAGGFGVATRYNVSGDLWSISAVDVNGDGRPDLVAASDRTPGAPDRSGAFVLLNQSTAPGTFIPGSAATAPGAVTGLVVDTTGGTSPAPPGAPDLAAASDSGASTSDNLTRVTTPVLTGTAVAGATVRLYDTDGRTVLGTAIADTAGRWSITSQVLTAGAHTLTAVQTDLAGNASAASASLTVTVDTSAAAPSAPDLAASSDSGVSASDSLTRVTRPVFTGTAEAGAAVRLYDTDRTTVIGSAKADALGAWSIKTGVLSEGTQSVVAMQTDRAGNASVLSRALRVTIDTTPPAAPGAHDLTASSDTGASNSDNATRNNRPTFAGTGAVDATVTLYDGSTAIGSAKVDASGAWSIRASELTDGAHAIRAQASDAAGNTSAFTTTVMVTIDTTPPAAPSAPDLAASSDSGASSSDNLTRMTTPVFTGTAEAGATVRLYDTNGRTVLGTGIADNAGRWSINSQMLTAGAHAVTAVQTDIAGNVSGASAPLTVTIDPSVAAPGRPDLAAASDSGVSASDNVTRVTRPVFTGTAEAGAAVRLYDTDGTTIIGSATADASGAWSIRAGVLSEGSHSVAAMQTDRAGNASALSRALPVTIDTTPPAAPSAPDLTASSDSGASDSDNVTRNTRPTFVGTGDAGATVTLYDGASAIGSAKVDASGAWSIRASELAGGAHTVRAQASDAAGNTSAFTRTLAVTIEAPAELVSDERTSSLGFDGLFHETSDHPAGNVVGPFSYDAFNLHIAAASHFASPELPATVGGDIIRIDEHASSQNPFAAHTNFV